MTSGDACIISASLSVMSQAKDRGWGDSAKPRDFDDDHTRRKKGFAKRDFSSLFSQFGFSCFAPQKKLCIQWGFPLYNLRPTKLDHNNNADCWEQNENGGNEARGWPRGAYAARPSL